MITYSKRFLYTASLLTLGLTSIAYSQSLSQLVESNPSKALEGVNAKLEQEPNNEEALFLRARIYHKNGKLEQAKRIYRKLIKQVPAQPEPYINLAAILSDQGEEQAAQKILIAGLNGHKGYAQLYNNLKSMNGRLAAMAYQQALNTKNTLEPKVALKTTSKLSVPATVIKEVVKEVPVEVIKEIVKEVKVPFEVIKKVEVIKEVVREVKVPVEVIKEVVKEVKVPFEVIKNVEVIKEVVREVKVPVEVIKEVVKEVKVPFEVIKKVEVIKEVVREVKVPVEVIKKVEVIKEVVREVKVPAVVVKQVVKETPKPITVKPTTTAAKAPDLSQRVQAWASAWSDRNVNDYTRFYVNNYSPKEGLSHAGWIRDRNIKIGGKSFIDVNASDFRQRVRNGGQQIDVIFKQAYRSNSVNDTITKRLRFAQENGQWKIIQERVIGR